jgi:hypothetical protein
MLSRRSVICVVICALAALALAACGGSPSGPSSDQGVTLNGRVHGGPVAFVSAASGASSSATLTVTVVGTSISTTVTTDGTFTLRGLPEGSFTLEFFDGATSLGTIDFTDVNANQEITITVLIEGSTITLLDQRRNGIGHGDLEIEGKVDAVVTLDPTGESVFTIDGYMVVARPLETSIREGNQRRGVEDVTVGRKVHVKGTWETNASGGQQVLAHEIKLQDADDGDDGDDDGGGQNSWCPDAGKKVEVEGKITAKGAADITVAQQGKGNFLANVDASTRIRKGNTTLTFDQLAVGNRVHVKGSSLGLSGDTCGVQATEVKLQ